MRRTLLLLACALSLVLFGCPEEEGPPPGPTCVEEDIPEGFDPAPPTSFSRDVMPVFKTSCAFSTCHGSTAGDANGVFLGGNDATRVRNGLVALKARKLPSMPLVTPGEPSRSFLMRKVDGTQCSLDAQCAGQTCGDRMPLGQGDLGPGRSAIRRWILQGAKDD
jgi:hypothetical protein